MSRPWDNEQATATAKLERDLFDVSCGVALTRMRNHARDLEREVRHARRLLASVLTHLPIVACQSFHHKPSQYHSGCEACLPMREYTNTIDAIGEHLAAAKEEGE